MIECVHYTDEQGFIAWRARGRTARTMADLAAMLGVDVSEMQPRPDPEQYAAAERRQRWEKARGLCKGANFDPVTGR